MKRPFAALLACAVLLSLTGCVNKEIEDISNKMNAATAQYTSWDIKKHSHWYSEGDIYEEGYTTTFEQEDIFEYRHLSNGNETGKGKIVYNRGTHMESSEDAFYYLKDGADYFDIGGERYKSAISNFDAVNEFGCYFIGGDFVEADFKKVSVTGLEDGGKKIVFMLNPSAFTEGPIYESLKSWLEFLPYEYVGMDTVIKKFIYTMIIDENYLLKKDSVNMDLTLTLGDGFDHNSTFSMQREFYNYRNLNEDHLVFPDDLKDYPFIN